MKCIDVSPERPTVAVSGKFEFDKCDGEGRYTQLAHQLFACGFDCQFEFACQIAKSGTAKPGFARGRFVQIAAVQAHLCRGKGGFAGQRMGQQALVQVGRQKAIDDAVGCRFIQGRFLVGRKSLLDQLLQLGRIIVHCAKMEQGPELRVTPLKPFVRPVAGTAENVAATVAWN
jgi:hypothetical protein